MVLAWVGPAQAKAAAPASTRSDTLEAIHHIENPSDSPRPGRYGELGAYQFRRTTWRMYSKLPFERALDQEAADEVAVRHYEWLKSGLARNGWKQTPYNIALAWNGGLNAVVNGRTSAATRDYAQRVSNLVLELRSGSLVTLH
jgi:hypothetical protein